MKIFVWPVLLLILVDSCNYSSDKGFPPSLTNQIRQKLDSLTRYHGIPGATFALRTSEGRTLTLAADMPSIPSLNGPEAGWSQPYPISPFGHSNFIEERCCLPARWRE